MAIYRSRSLPVIRPGRPINLPPGGTGSTAYFSIQIPAPPNQAAEITTFQRSTSCDWYSHGPDQGATMHNDYCGSPAVINVVSTADITLMGGARFARPPFRLITIVQNHFSRSLELLLRIQSNHHE